MNNSEEDLKKLDTLLEYESLDDWEKEAFSSMREKLSQTCQKLSTSQRSKVMKAWKRLGLDADDGAKNLWSSGKVPEGNRVKLAYESMPRPLKPPGRK